MITHSTTKRIDSVKFLARWCLATAVSFATSKNQFLIENLRWIMGDGFTACEKAPVSSPTLLLLKKRKCGNMLVSAQV